MQKLLFLQLLRTLSVTALPASHWSGPLIAQFWEAVPSDAPTFWEEISSSTEPANFWMQEPIVPVEKAISAPSRAPVSQVYQFKDYTALENLAARADGSLVLTSMSAPNLYLIDPNKRNPKAELLYSFPGATSLSGVLETTPDVFVVVAGNWSLKTFEGIRGSFEVWSIDLNTKTPTVKSIAKIPEAAALNGITHCHTSATKVLIADSGVGAIWRLDTNTGEYAIAFKDPLFTNCTSKFPLGLNGVSMFDGHLHFANSALRIYGRVPIDEAGGATNEIEIVGRALPSVTAFDDVVLDWAGNAWIATHPNAITQITAQGKQRNFTGTDVTMMNPTSIVWGRGSPEAEKILYVSTNGANPAGGWAGAQVVSLDTRLI